MLKDKEFCCAHMEDVLKDTSFFEYSAITRLYSVNLLNVLNWIEYLKSQGFTNKCQLFRRITTSFTKQAMPCLVLEKEFIKCHNQKNYEE